MVRKLKTMVKLAAKMLLLGLVFSVLLTGCDNSVTGILNPKGMIAYKERQLLFDSIAIMLVVVIPVIIMSFEFVYRYRVSQRTSEYKPNWAHSNFLEAIWWAIPCAIIVFLGIMAWRSTHTLDPYRKIDVPGKPMLIQVVALPWKWLFIYPKQNIATVNFLELPKDKQVEFWITSDNVPMSSFFIPQLGSQIYSMAGMRTRLHLLGTETGTFEGLNSQYNGQGFSDMHFKVKIVEPKDMRRWVREVKQSSNSLTTSQMEALALPTVAEPVKYYSSVKRNLFDNILKSYHRATPPRPFEYHSVHP